MERPKTQYVYVGDAQVAYQVVGDGPIDVFYLIDIGGSIDLYWDDPTCRGFFERVASYGRLILMDRRGVGMSDRVPLKQLGTWEHYIEDVSAVVDAVGTERVAFIGYNTGGALAMIYAATNPERTSALALWQPSARQISTDDYAFGVTPEENDAVIAMLKEIWGTRDVAAVIAPSRKDDDAYMEWLARVCRTSCTPDSAAAQMANVSEMDVREFLPLIQTPTLVLSRRDGPFPQTLAGSRYVADRVAGARYVEFDGSDLMPWDENGDEIQDVIEEFLTGVTPVRPMERVLATVLFTDIVRSTEQLADAGDSEWRKMIERNIGFARSAVDAAGGRFIKWTGDGVLATFDLPGRAIRCGVELADRLSAEGLETRTGLHIGEIELMGDDIGGIAVHVAQRVMSAGGPADVICTRTIRDLVAGSGISMADHGTHRLKGLSDEWQLFKVTG